MRFKSSMLALAVIALSLLFAPPRASAKEPHLLYATANTTIETELVAVNLKAMKVRVIGDIGFGPFSLPLAFCQPGKVSYTITNTFDPTTAQLATLSLGTGAATLVGSPLPQALNIMGMTCSPGGSLYAIGQSDSGAPNFNSLYAVNRETGVASLIGPTGVLDLGDPSGFSGFLMALAFAPDGTLYGVNSKSTLFSVSPLTGVATPVVTLVGVPFVMGLAIDRNGTFYVADFAPESKIYTVDLDTGVATLILNTGLPFVHNIAFRTP
jgi:hypothetical protein